MEANYTIKHLFSTKSQSSIAPMSAYEGKRFALFALFITFFIYKTGGVGACFSQFSTTFTLQF